MQSAEGAQQGDPLGPFYFCLDIKDLLESRTSELILDDITLGDNAAICAQDLKLLEETAGIIGLELNHSKCEIIGHTNYTRTLFASLNIFLPGTNPLAAVLLGAPLSAGHHLDSVLEDKRLELKRLVMRLQLMPAHDSLFLLRNVLSASRLMYLLRTAPCTGSPVLTCFDVLLRESLALTLNVDLNDDRWQQASLPVRWGGLGVRGVVSLAPSAYLASAASTSELISVLLPARLSDFKDSGIEVALSAWITRASGPSSRASPPITSKQRDWDDACCKISSEFLLNSAADMVNRSRLLAASSLGSGDWLEALPLASIGLKMDNATVRIAVGLRLGAPVVRPHTCICGATVSVFGHHGLS